MEPETPPAPARIPIYKQPIHRQVMQMHLMMSEEFFWAKFLGGALTGLIVGYILGKVI